MASKFNRIQELIRHLRSHPEGIGLLQLAKNLTVDSRTVKRYIAELRNTGHPVLDLRGASNEPSRFYLSPEFAPPKALIDSLKNIQNDLQAWGNPKYVHNISAAVDFLNQLNSNKKNSNPITNPSQNENAYHIDHGPLSESDVAPGLIATLEKAIQLCLKLKLNYKAAGEKVNNLVFCPYKISLRVGRLYVIGELDLEPGVFKSLSVKRIKRCQTSSESFKPKTFDVNEYYRYCFGQFPRQPQEKPTVIRLQINSPWIHTILEESHFNPPGKFKLSKNMETFEFLAILKPDLENWVLSLVPHAIPLAPKKLQTDIKNRLEQAVTQLK